VLVPDQLWSELYRSSEGGDLRENEAKSAYAKWTVSDLKAGVERMKPKSSTAARRTRIKRDDLGNLINQSVANRYAKLQDGAKYVQSRGRTVVESDPDAVILGAGQPFLAELLTRTLGYRYQNSVLLSTAPDLMAITPGDNLKWDFARMNSGMKAAVESLLFNQPVNATMGGTSSGISVNTEQLPQRLAADNEATEKYPNGIPGDFSISLNVKEESGVLGRIRGQLTGRMLTAIDFGAIYGFTEGQGGGQGDYPITQFEEFLKATVRSIAVNLPGNSINYTDGQVGVGAKVISISELDKSFLERGMVAREALRQAAENMTKRGQQAPPPR
jgi:hypothetical protein